mmetsp:Transcript_23018/g.46712  ORF Transcript_23018/g.46712 Transcript_23018/m.46712 type:complete len:256 (-) Transcript_23018:66-833(-)
MIAAALLVLILIFIFGQSRQEPIATISISPIPFVLEAPEASMERRGQIVEGVAVVQRLLGHALVHAGQQPGRVRTRRGSQRPHRNLVRRRRREVLQALLVVQNVRVDVLDGRHRRRRRSRPRPGGRLPHDEAGDGVAPLGVSPLVPPRARVRGGTHVAARGPRAGPGRRAGPDADGRGGAAESGRDPQGVQVEGRGLELFHELFLRGLFVHVRELGHVAAGGGVGVAVGTVIVISRLLGLGGRGLVRIRALGLLF